MWVNIRDHSKLKKKLFYFQRISFRVSGLFCFLIPALFSCKDRAGSQQEYFPNTPGDSWTYEVTDSTQSTSKNTSEPQRYTVSVKITGVKKLVDGKYATIWRYEYPSGYDTTFVRIVSDTIMFFAQGYTSGMEYLKYPELVFVTPFASSECWSGKLLTMDSLCVTGVSSIITPAGKFDGCFQIDSRYAGPNAEHEDTYWFRPSLRMVRIFNNHYDGAPRQFRTWKLISYTLR